MKNFLYIIAASTLLLGSCSSLQNTSSKSTSDDLYFSKSAAANKPVYNPEVQLSDVSPANSSSYKESPQVPNSNQSSYVPEQSAPASSTVPISSSTTTVSDDGKTYITNNYYGDVYSEDEWEYAMRLQRFSRPFYGMPYYSPAYVGFYFDPFMMPGPTVGIGWNSYSGWNVGIGFGVGWGYNPYYNPWYGPGYGYNPWYGPGYGYGHGYNNGYHHGYWNGYYDGMHNGGYGNGNTVVNSPRPSRGGSTSSGYRGSPTAGSTPASNSGRPATNTGRPSPTASPAASPSARPADVNRTSPTSSPAARPASETRTSPGNYVAPSIPNPGDTRTSPSTGDKKMQQTKPDASPTRSPSPNSTVSPSKTPSKSSSPSYNSSPSRSSSPSSPSRSSGGSGGGSRPSSGGGARRPR